MILLISAELKSALLEKIEKFDSIEVPDEMYLKGTGGYVSGEYDIRRLVVERILEDIKMETHLFSDIISTGNIWVPSL